MSLSAIQPFQPSLGGSIPLHVIEIILSYYNDLHDDDETWHVELSESTGRLRLKVHTHPEFLSQLSYVHLHKHLNPPIRAKAIVRNQCDVYREMFTADAPELPPLQSVTMYRMPVYECNQIDYYYEPTYTVWDGPLLDTTYAHTIRMSPMSESLAHRRPSFHRGWKYDRWAERTHQMIYHCSLTQNEDMVFHSNDLLSTTLFEKDGWWEYDSTRNRWDWTMYT